jgi:cytochrome c-type biogenesis protein
MEVNFALAFTAGVLSFLSPCVLPLIPSYMVLMTGISAEELEKGSKKYFLLLLIHSCLFVTGFSTVFISLAIAVNYFGKYIPFEILSVAGGIIVILFGLHLSGLIKFSIFYKIKKPEISRKTTLAGSFVVGMIFAAGWSPCIGPILGSILLYSSVHETVYKAVFLLIAYCLGLGLPFIAVCVAGIGFFVKILNKFKKYFPVVRILSGILLIITGILILAGNFWVK